jgi:SET domain-containing protein
LITKISDLGWRVVQEYEANPLADDSDDEKKLFKAEARAERKVKAEKSKKTKRTHPYVTPATDKFTQGQKPGRCFNCGVKDFFSSSESSASGFASYSCTTLHPRSEESAIFIIFCL